MLPGLRHGELTTMRTSFNFTRSYWSTLYSDGQHTIVILHQVVFEVAELLLLLFLLLLRLKARNLFPLPASSPHLPDHYNYLSGFKNRQIVYTHTRYHVCSTCCCYNTPKNTSTMGPTDARHYCLDLNATKNFSLAPTVSERIRRGCCPVHYPVSLPRGTCGEPC